MARVEPNVMLPWMNELLRETLLKGLVSPVSIFFFLSFFLNFLFLGLRVSSEKGQGEFS